MNRKDNNIKNIKNEIALFLMFFLKPPNAIL